MSVTASATWTVAKSENLRAFGRKKEADVDKARERLASRWFPRFDDPQHEYAFVMSISDKENKKQLPIVWLIGTTSVLLLHGQTYLTTTLLYNDVASNVKIAVLSSKMMQILLIQMLLVYRLSMHRIRVAADTFISIVFVAGVVVLFTSNWWRMGAIIEGDGKHLFKATSGDSTDADTTSDLTLLVSLIALAVGVNACFHTRATHSLFVSVSLPLSYAIFSIPQGWSPDPRARVATTLICLCCIVSMLWGTQRQREVQQRTNWWRMHELEEKVNRLDTLVSSQEDEVDDPSMACTPSGIFTLKWVGPHVHDKLLPFAGSVEIDEMEHAWAINASPFVVDVCSDDHSVRLPAYSYCEAPTVPQDGLMLRVGSPCTETVPWKRLSSTVELKLDAADWSKHGRIGEELKLHCWDNEVLRAPLPLRGDGGRMGSLKCVRGPNGLFLMTWSPPAEVRGMPLKEFENFLLSVIDYPDDWECKKTLEDGSNGTVNKKQGDSSRNMYDACKHLIRPIVARVDASYAEVNTDFGPADLFGSHVWGEEAGNTLKAIRSFTIGDGKQNHRHSESRAAEVKPDCRIWFCTCCNNQFRVTEELGTNVSMSPFARVIKSPVCTRIAVISPLLALSRKWCNFEFSLGHARDLEVVLVTPSGVVQAGQVAPKTLHQLATHLRDFSCVNATCSSSEDKALIDHAIAEMGGYDKLDANLRSTFSKAIHSAHDWTSRALQEIETPAKERLQDICTSDSTALPETETPPEEQLQDEGFPRRFTL